VSLRPRRPLDLSSAAEALSSRFRREAGARGRSLTTDGGDKIVRATRGIPCGTQRSSPASARGADRRSTERPSQAVKPGFDPAKCSQAGRLTTRGQFQAVQDCLRLIGLKLLIFVDRADAPQEPTLMSLCSARPRHPANAVDRQRRTR
jgi:hypothetical protein